jgi:hypothetical protein
MNSWVGISPTVEGLRLVVSMIRRLHSSGETLLACRVPSTAEVRRSAATLVVQALLRDMTLKGYFGFPSGPNCEM